MSQPQSNPETRQDVDVIEHVWIPMPDGVRLAARLWLPKATKHVPAPAIFEYIPYRKADMVRARDERNHPYFAAHGYVCLRVDMRGSGDSEGQMDDMYAPHELADARHVINWIASQPWCDGQVGMFGTSWGGTASLQANVDAPEALKAIIAVCATHDRYEDDIHHMGGCLLTDTFEWGATLPAILAAPPTPNVGPDWKDLWQKRLDGLAFPVEAWVREEARGTYWRHGSVIHEAERLSRPILAVGGWSDRYSNSVMSLAAARPDLVWGVVGPWGHHYPDHGHPGPAIGFQSLALAWWARWMKPSKAVEEWPHLRVWMRDFDAPTDAIDTRHGRWIETGPSDQATQTQTWYLADRGLVPTQPDSDTTWCVPADLSVGQASGDTGYFGRYGGLPLDQAEDDARSLVFETEPLENDLVLYGLARVSLEISTNAPRAQVSLRLNDVAPDGVVTRVAYGVRNLALDETLDVLPDAAGGLPKPFAVPLHSTAYRFRKGHRMRLSLAQSYWPLVWTPPLLNEMALIGGQLRVPVLREPIGNQRQPLPPPQDLPVIKTHRVQSSPALIRTCETSASGTRINGWRQPFTEVSYANIGTAFGYETAAEHRMIPGQPNSVQSHILHHARYTRPDGIADIESTLKAQCDTDQFYLHGQVTVTWNGDTCATHEWQRKIPRRRG